MMLDEAATRSSLPQPGHDLSYKRQLTTSNRLESRVDSYSFGFRPVTNYVNFKKVGEIGREPRQCLL